MTIQRLLFRSPSLTGRKVGLFPLFALLLAVTPLPRPAFAINFATGSKLEEGFYLNLYPYWYTADTMNNKNGHAIMSGLGLDKYGMYLGGTYYRGDLLLNALVPVGQEEVGAVHGKDGGLGDIQLRAGYFLPVTGITILSAVAAKVPTGSFDKNRAVNFGDGQTDIMAEMYFFKLFGRFSVDWLLKYSVRLRNPDSDLTPGNEYSTEGLVTYKLVDGLRAGPSVTFKSGADNRKAGQTLANSGLAQLAAGGEVDCVVSPQAKVSLAVLKDVYTRNTTEGLLVMGRIIIPF
ncbi:MAG TPA: transporter [Desulfuromonadaceae bacterium]